MNLISTMGVSALVAATGLLTAGTVNAQSLDRVFTTNAAGICQGALPVFETAIRKRPLGVQNEGTSNAFVTCAFTSQGGLNASGTTRVSMWFKTNSGTATTISCTGVTGYDTGVNQFITKTAVAPAAGGQVNIQWTGADFAGAPAEIPDEGLFSVSCALPRGAVINDSYLNFEEDIEAPAPN